MIFENVIVEVYEVLVKILLKFFLNCHINSCGKYINLSDAVWVIVFILFELLSHTFTFYLQVDNILNVVLQFY